MTTKLCVHCKIEPVRTVNDLLCKLCRAEKLLAGEDVSVRALDALAAGSGGPGSVAYATDGATSVFARTVRCECCGGSETYSHEKAKSSYFCDLCGKALCTACAAYCNHKDWNYTAKIVCKLCRAETSLTGQPVEEVEGSLPGQAPEALKREPKPHCGRATCIADPKLVEYDRTHACPTPNCTDHPSFCECRCQKCMVAVSAGFVEPMFGKMTPDPDPVPEDKIEESGAYRRRQEDGDDEEEIARWEGGQQ